MLAVGERAIARRVETSSRIIGRIKPKGTDRPRDSGSARFRRGRRRTSILLGWLPRVKLPLTSTTARRKTLRDRVERIRS